MGVRVYLRSTSSLTLHLFQSGACLRPTAEVTGQDAWIAELERQVSATSRNSSTQQVALWDREGACAYAIRAPSGAKPWHPSTDAGDALGHIVRGGD